MSKIGIALVLAFAVGCSPSAVPSTQAGPGAAPPAAVVAGDSPVELEASFLIPQKEGQSLSHTPSVVFTADGRRMVTATSDREIVEFDVASRKLLKKIPFPGEVTDAVSIDAGGRLAVWVLKKGGMAVMDIASAKIVARDEHLASKWVALSPDGRRVAVSTGTQVSLHELPSLKLAESLQPHDDEVTNLAWSGNGRLLGSTSKDGTIRVRDVEAKRTIHEAKKAGALYALAFHPGGGFVAYGGDEKKIYQFEFGTSKEDVIAEGQPFWITCLGYSPDGSKLTAGDESCDIWLFTLKDKKLAFHSKHHVECWLSSVAWAPDKETFLFGCRPNSLAGRPALWAENQRAEAARSDAVRRCRDELLKGIDKELAATKDPEAKKSLDAYRASLKGEESLQTMNQLGGWEGLTLNGAYFQSDAAVVQTKSVQSAAAPAKLPPALQKLAQDHETELQNEMKRLGTSYCVNQYRIK
ncbi:MAG: WD40 repeat domain-containing protein [Planctomycetes bacterium]|nr:WD40 repeat domain-containing protein [Planctomycetota bacterium]